MNGGKTQGGGTLLCLAVAMLGGCSRPEPGETPILGILERERIEVTAEVREPVAMLAVRAGDSVAAGDVLARLDDARAVLAVEAAEARLRGIEARLAELARGGRHEVLDQVRGRIAEHLVAVAQAEVDVRRSTSLVQAGVAPQTQLDLAVVSLETSRARLDQDRARLAELLAGAPNEEMRQAQADYEAAQTQILAARLDLDRLTLRAPADGRVESVIYRPGERPEPGLPVIVLLADGRPYVRVHVPEPLRARVVPGVRAGISADGLDSTLAGTVRFVASEASFTPYYALSEHDRHRLSFVAEIDLEPAAGAGAPGDRDLPSGLPVRVRFEGFGPPAEPGSRP